MHLQKSTYGRGGRFFPNAARSFYRNDPKIFLRVLEDVWKDYNYGRRYILTPKTFYSLEKFQKSWKTALFTTFLVPTNSLWSEYQITKTTILSRFPSKKNVFMHFIDLKMFSTYSLDQGEHVTYPQYHVICHRIFSNAIWN